MYNGIINIYKEPGFTSHDVVGKLRGILKQKKIGHTGTLDPDAVGVLPVCLGNATKLCDMLTDRSKEYVATFRLGIVTDTQDISGNVLAQKEVLCDKEQVLRTIKGFEGDILQIPPMYSALKVNGQKLVDLARKGIVVERKARPITIYSISVLQDNHPEYQISVSCSKGTYIRTLCHDIGEKLGCGAVMTSLQRTRVGEFQITSSVKLSELEKMVCSGTELPIIPTEYIFQKMPALQVTGDGIKGLQNGNVLTVNMVKSFREKDSEQISMKDSQEYRVYDEKERFTAVYVWNHTARILKPVKMFFE